MSRPILDIYLPKPLFTFYYPYLGYVNYVNYSVYPWGIKTGGGMLGYVGPRSNIPGGTLDGGMLDLLHRFA